ncbi:MAG: 6-pyruvoyl trahydropterin synthase family protein [Candidatus Rariloculaceae bacterium]
MYIVCVRDHFMIAHSFKGKVFGPAQKLHGATYVVDVEFRRLQLDEDGVIVDIGLASETLKSILKELNYKNLDESDEFTEKNTTTEFLAHTIFQRMEAKVHEGLLGTLALSLNSMRVTLHESHVAWAAYEGPIDKGMKE